MSVVQRVGDQERVAVPSISVNFFASPNSTSSTVLLVLGKCQHSGWLAETQYEHTYRKRLYKWVNWWMDGQRPDKQADGQMNCRPCFEFHTMLMPTTELHVTHSESPPMNELNAKVTQTTRSLCWQLLSVAWGKATFDWKACSPQIQQPWPTLPIWTKPMVLSDQEVTSCPPPLPFLTTMSIVCSTDYHTHYHGSKKQSKHIIHIGCPSFQCHFGCNELNGILASATFW